MPLLQGARIKTFTTLANQIIGFIHVCFALFLSLLIGVTFQALLTKYRNSLPMSPSCGIHRFKAAILFHKNGLIDHNHICVNSFTHLAIRRGSYSGWENE